MSTTRRQFLKYGLAGGAGIAGYSLLGEGWAQAATGPLALASFTQPLQVPPLLAPVPDPTTGIASYTLTAKHATRKLHPKLPAETHVWCYLADPNAAGYRDPNPGGYRGFLGPTVVVQKGRPVQVTYENKLEATYGQVAWLPCDKNLTMRDANGTSDDTVRLLTHLHGGFVHGQMDGNPAVDRGYTKDQAQTVWYGNEQRAAMIWYHDHGMGNTRLNVWAGLAGGYVIRDEIDNGEPDNTNHLPVGYGKYEVPLVFQDRSFAAGSGDFLYPTFPQDGVMGSWGLAGGGLTGNEEDMANQYGTLNGPWAAEAFGDKGLVNGLVAPYFNVEPRLYRFRCLNGCNARILDLQMVGGLVGGVKAATPPPMWIIGNDQGMLPAPVKIKTLTMMPGERYDLLVDFTGYTGKAQLKNTNLNGFYTSPAPRLVDFIQFQIGTTVTDWTNASFYPKPNAVPPQSGVPATLAGGMPASLPAAASVRRIDMFEMNAGAMNWWMGLIGTGGAPGVDVDVEPGGFPDRINPTWNANTFHQKVGERPQEGAVQEWDFANNTADSHPMHMHLVQFQVVSRRQIGAAVPADGTLVNTWEKGWKDTVAVHPGQVTRIRAKFDLPPVPDPTKVTLPTPANYVPDGTSMHYDLQGQGNRCFVYHCHILEHEENDMMRPFLVT